MPSSHKATSKCTSTALPKTASKATAKVLPSQQHPDHYHAHDAVWWFDCHTQAGRKSENQASILITTCLPYQQTAHPTLYPLLVILADGVSACQFPKQASRLAIDIVAQHITHSLPQLSQSQPPFEDAQVASLIKLAVNKANDALYFSQAYQRIAPLLSTLSGVLCIADRIHLFHTGDSRIYRVTVDSLTALTTDYRIHHGQDKGALSAALGADTKVELQQDVFTLHQNECLALMTDGVYEHIDPIEMQFDLSAHSADIFAMLAQPTMHTMQNQPPVKFLDAHISSKLCEQALMAGSNDNLSMILLGMSDQSGLSGLSSGQDWQHWQNGENKQTDASPTPSTATAPMTRYQLVTGLTVGDKIDGFVVRDVIARTARSEVYLVQDEAKHCYALKSPSMSTVDDGHYLREFLKERKIGLSLSKHRHAGETAYNQNDPNHLRGQLKSPLKNQPKVSLDKGNSAHLQQASKDTPSTNFIHSHPYYPEHQSTASSSGLLRYYPVPASSPYLYHLTEYIDGESLRAFIERQAPCDIWQTHDLLTKIGMAVRVMHRNYLLHQDIKPENILLTKTGAVRLIDFGSASSSILKDSTRPPNGDLHYAAPEYYTDAPKGVHSDLFSIAVIGFELLTAELPFSAQALMSPAQTLAMPTQLLRQHQVPISSQQALMRALHPNTNVRYQAIGEFLRDFNPDNSVSQSDPIPLIKRNPLLVWHGICFIQTILIILLLIRFSPYF